MCYLCPDLHLGAAMGSTDGKAGIQRLQDEGSTPSGSTSFSAAMKHELRRGRGIEPYCDDLIERGVCICRVSSKAEHLPVEEAVASSSLARGATHTEETERMMETVRAGRVVHRPINITYEIGF